MAKVKKASQSKAKQTVSADDQNDDGESTNRPRNFYITDANHLFSMAFHGRFGLQQSITINQTPEDNTWPGGALWDLGVLISNVLLGIAGVTLATTTTSCTLENSKNNSVKFKSKNHNIRLRPILADSKLSPDWIHSIMLSENSIVLELGCGVGLTGLVAAAALRPALVLLTDLDVVIEKVTRQNVEQNTQAEKEHHILGKTPCIARALCWGNNQDEEEVAKLIAHYQQKSSSSPHKRKSKKKSTKPANEPILSKSVDGKADIVLIGDVAYQHKPGAASHFEVLHSTLLKFLHDNTIVIFGTRIRMPASNDLLQLLLQDLEELIVPSIAADEIDPSFGKFKHNMKIHFLRLKRKEEKDSSF